MSNKKILIKKLGKIWQKSDFYVKLTLYFKYSDLSIIKQNG